MRSPLTVTNPITNEAITELRHDTPDDVRAAVHRAGHAQAEWGALPFRRRARALVRFHDLLVERSDEVMDVIQAETGKSRRDAFAEIFAVASEARYYAYHGEGHLRERAAKAAIPLRERVRVAYRPHGVVGIISPWNFPLILSIGDAIPAMLAGNTVIIKPSEVTPLSAMKGRELLLEAGIHPDIVQIVNGYGETLSGPLVDAVDYVMFTGSDRVGRIIAERAAQTLTPVTLELGGKNSLIVLEDANIKHAATVAVEGAFNNAGQVCINWERVFVQETIYDRFMAEFVRQTEGVRQGPGRTNDTDLGSLINEAHSARVWQHIEDAIAQGATVITGAATRPQDGPAFIEPTILTDVTPEMDLFYTETFGPVVAVTPFSTADEAIALANDTEYGLHCGICTRDLARGERLAARIEAGTVSINDTYTMWAAIDAPMGGVKSSGIGRRHGPEGIRQYTHTQTIFTNRTPLQVGDGQTAMSISDGLMGMLRLGLRVWRRVPFLR